jgi:hypothetical protein
MESFLVKVAGLSNPQCVWILVRNTEYQFCFKVFGQFHMYHEKLSTFCGLCRRTTKWPSRKAPKIVGGWVVMTIIAILAKGINDPCCCYHYHYQQISTVCSFCAMSSWLYTVFWRIIFVVINYNYIHIHIYRFHYQWYLLFLFFRYDYFILRRLLRQRQQQQLLLQLQQQQQLLLLLLLLFIIIFVYICTFFLRLHHYHLHTVCFVIHDKCFFCQL